MSNVDELARLKELLDNGTLTQEEYEIEKQKLSLNQSMPIDASQPNDWQQSVPSNQTPNSQPSQNSPFQQHYQTSTVESDHKIYKKWWFWVIIVVIIFIFYAIIYAIASQDEDNNPSSIGWPSSFSASTDSEPTSSTPSSSEQPSEPPTFSDPMEKLVYTINAEHPNLVDHINKDNDGGTILYTVYLTDVWEEEYTTFYKQGRTAQFIVEECEKTFDELGEAELFLCYGRLASNDNMIFNLKEEDNQIGLWVDGRYKDDWTFE